MNLRASTLAWALSTSAQSAVAAPANFDRDATDQAPSGWTCGSTGSGKAKWTVEGDASAPSRINVLRQSGVADFPWCVQDSGSFADRAVQVKFKALAGREDQAGGVVWRWKNGDNYYVARANALDNNVALYYTERGNRRTIKYVDAEVATNTWHTLRVEFSGSQIRVILDGKTVIELSDTHINGAGLTGVWTKADSVTVFDDFDSRANGRDTSVPK